MMKSSLCILIVKDSNGCMCNESWLTEPWVLKQKFRKSPNSEAMLQKSQLVQDAKKKGQVLELLGIHSLFPSFLQKSINEAFCVQYHYELALVIFTDTQLSNPWPGETFQVGSLVFLTKPQITSLFCSNDKMWQPHLAHSLP